MFLFGHLRQVLAEPGSENEELRLTTRCELPSILRIVVPSTYRKDSFYPYYKYKPSFSVLVLHV